MNQINSLAGVTDLVRTFTGTGSASTTTFTQGLSTVLTAMGGWTAAGTLWTVFMDLLKQQNLGRVLAEPNLVTTSGQQAAFLAGGEFPIPVPQSGVGGAATITVEYKKFGVQLEFTPTVLNEGKIAVKVHPTVGGAGAPTFGRSDRAQRIAELERRLVDPLKPLARVAYNLRWSWIRRGGLVFAEIDPHRWRLAARNPVRFLFELNYDRQLVVAQDANIVQRVNWLAHELDSPPARRRSPGAEFDGTVAYFSAEFGVHTSLPGYSGGLGVLAGDVLKEASDRGLSMVGIGLFYRRGYFVQRLDLAGTQQEYWLDHDPAELPMALVNGDDGEPLRLSGHALRPRDRVPGLVRAGRQRVASPARRGDARERPGQPLDDGAAPTTATRTSASRSTACSASAARACSRRSTSGPTSCT